ncbi:hypothetical protein [Fructobacillus tropaeoli]|uniref:hypothetical protein n=1 Tax=Fructobacillus tropaeoli TaxID=709323 RepID=UPI001A28DB84|nr:hypothetical protein FT12353_00670 [Fructobacillus tropaeoli]
MNNLKDDQKIRFQANQTGPKPFLLNGVIEHIDDAPIETKQGNVYLIRAKMALKNADYDQIRYGLEGKVSVITGKKTWINYIKSLIFNNE